MICQEPDEQWLFLLEELACVPSVQQGMPWREELRERAKAVHVLHEIGINMMKLPTHVIFSAVMYLHRFYVQQSFQHYPPHEMIPTCLFLACKVEECARKGPEIAGVCLERQAELTGGDMTAKSEFSPQNKDLTAKILYNEDVLLRNLAYDLALEHPMILVIEAISLILPPIPKDPPPPSSVWETEQAGNVEKEIARTEFSRQTLAEIVQGNAQEIIFDLEHTPLLLLVPPIVAAALAVYLAFLKVGIDLDDWEGPVDDDDPSITYELQLEGKRAWLDLFQTSKEVIDQTQQILIELYYLTENNQLYDGSTLLHRALQKYRDQDALHFEATIEPIFKRPPVNLLMDSAVTVKTEQVSTPPVQSASDNADQLHTEERLRLESGMKKEELRASISPVFNATSPD